MGKKDKKKQGKGAEKTATKTEKNAERKAQKALRAKGEEDIETLITQFQEQDRQREQVTEEKVPPPSARCNMTLTPHPDKDELIMFGGEYFNGSKTYVYNDLLFYNLKTNDWTKVSCPKAPPPRCAHQAVALRQGGGQLWVFGGEFTNPSQTQFYHYKDLWVYHIKEKLWDKVSAPGGPSSRSGHRMVVCKRQLLLFGGFHDNVRDYQYFNDVYAFNLDEFTWTKLDVSGVGPSPRSACQMAVTQDQVLVYGGYSKERVKKDVDKGTTHVDMFLLTPEGKQKEDQKSCPTKWKWSVVKQSGARPSQRCGFSLVTVPGNRAVLFGGVFDQAEDEESVEGVFYNEMYSLELDKGKWFDVFLRGKKDDKDRKRRRKKKKKVPTATLR